METLTGQLLIAGPNLWDPNFRRTVLLIGHHDEEGAVGVILNRASETTVAEAVPPLGSLVPVDDPVYLGGPVQPDAAVVVADFVDPAVADFLAFDTIGFLPSETEPGIEDAVRRARVFAGYAGWGAGQLETELEEDSWVVETARSSDVFFSIGTSGVVQPAASLAFAAHNHGALVVEVNAERTPLTPKADFALHGKSGEILPQLVKVVWG